MAVPAIHLYQLEGAQGSRLLQRSEAGAGCRLRGSLVPQVLRAAAVLLSAPLETHKRGCLWITTIISADRHRSKSKEDGLCLARALAAFACLCLPLTAARSSLRRRRGGAGGGGVDD
jgi:hypothetical protein